MPERNLSGIKIPFLCISKLGQKSLQPVVREGSHRDGAEGTLPGIKDLCLWKEGAYGLQSLFLDADYY